MYAHILGFNISLVKFSLGLKVENLAIGPSGTGFKVDMTFLTGININLNILVLHLLLTVLGFLAFCCQVSMYGSENSLKNCHFYCFPTKEK